MHGCPDVSARDTRTTLWKNENEENREAMERKGQLAFRQLLFPFPPRVSFSRRLTPGRFARFANDLFISGL